MADYAQKKSAWGHCYVTRSCVSILQKNDPSTWSCRAMKKKDHWQSSWLCHWNNPKNLGWKSCRTSEINVEISKESQSDQDKIETTIKTNSRWTVDTDDAKKISKDFFLWRSLRWMNYCSLKEDDVFNEILRLKCYSESSWEPEQSLKTVSTVRISLWSRRPIKRFDVLSESSFLQPLLHDSRLYFNPLI